MGDKRSSSRLADLQSATAVPMHVGQRLLWPNTCCTGGFSKLLMGALDVGLVRQELPKELVPETTDAPFLFSQKWIVIAFSPWAI